MSIPDFDRIYEPNRRDHMESHIYSECMSQDRLTREEEEAFKNRTKALLSSTRKSGLNFNNRRGHVMIQGADSENVFVIQWDARKASSTPPYLKLHHMYGHGSGIGRMQASQIEHRFARPGSSIMFTRPEIVADLWQMIHDLREDSETKVDHVEAMKKAIDDALTPPLDDETQEMVDQEWRDRGEHERELRRRREMREIVARAEHERGRRTQLNRPIDMVG